MIRKLTLVCCILCLANATLAAAALDDGVKGAYAKAAEVAKSGDRSALSAALRAAYEQCAGKALSGEDLFYAGSIATRLRRFDDAARWLESYLQGGGENGAVAAADLIEVYMWRNEPLQARDWYERFRRDYATGDARDPLRNGMPASIAAEISLSMALLRSDDAAGSTAALKRAIDAIGDNAQGYVSGTELLNYHSWYASTLAEQQGWQAAADFLTENTLPLFRGDPAMDAKVRDRILFHKLDHYIAADQIEEGLKELQDTIESFKVDDVSYRRVSHALKRFSLVNQPAPEMQIDAWIGGEPTALERLRGDVVLLYFFWSG